MLERFRKAQNAAVARLVEQDAAKNFPSPLRGARPDFSAALRKAGPGAVIAEYKRASPSLGLINAKLEPEDVAQAYATAGAACISVLTEEAHFQGSLAFIDRMQASGLPLLRKDFLVHPLQLRESAATAASAVLLIARMLDDVIYPAMLREAARHRLACVLEVFDKRDLERTRMALKAAGAAKGEAEQPETLIQVNNRNLDTLEVSDAPAKTLIRHKMPGELWIYASGISTSEQIQERVDMGFDALLIGSFLTKTGNPAKALANLLAGPPSNLQVGPLSELPGKNMERQP